MKPSESPSESPSASIPVHDYGLALKGAVSWLGDRYLLAAPLPRRNDERKNYVSETGPQPLTRFQRV